MLDFKSAFEWGAIFATGFACCREFVVFVQFETYAAGLELDALCWNCKRKLKLIIILS